LKYSDGKILKKEGVKTPSFLYVYTKVLLFI